MCKAPLPSQRQPLPPFVGVILFTSMSLNGLLVCDSILDLTPGFSQCQVRSWLSFFCPTCACLSPRHPPPRSVVISVGAVLHVYITPMGWNELPTLPSPSTQITSPFAAPVALSEVSNCLVFSLALLSMYFPLTNPQLFASCLNLLSAY